MAGKADRAQAARDALESNRRAALRLGEQAGTRDVRKLLERAAADLRERIARLDPRLADESFTAIQLQATLRQVELVLLPLTKGMQGVMVNAASRAAEQAAAHTIDYLETGERYFRGAAAQPLALNEVRMLNAAASGANASLLRRIVHGPELPHHAHHHRHRPRVRMGVLQRYGEQTVGHFEQTLQVGLAAKKSWREMREDITEQSPFLQGAPKFWGERIVRTEVMGAYARGANESIEEASKSLGGMVKILSSVFDDRTGADSYAVHGQIRRPEEDFLTWFGPVSAPPDRPNDRAVVTPHRIAWPIPAYLRWRTDDEVVSRWRAEGRKGPPPPRPQPMTTVPLEQFGK